MNGMHEDVAEKLQNMYMAHMVLSMAVKEIYLPA